MNTQIKFVIDKISELNISSVLNVGYRYDSDTHIQKYCQSNNIEWDVLEVYKPNCDSLKSNGHNYPIYNLDIRDISLLEKTWDMIIWLHGPEHVEWEDFKTIRHKIEKCANKIVIYQAPIGEWPQDAIYGNIYEKHLATLIPEMFEELQYKTEIHKTINENTFSGYIIK